MCAPKCARSAFSVATSACSSATRRGHSSTSAASIRRRCTVLDWLNRLRLIGPRIIRRHRGVNSELDARGLASAPEALEKAHHRNVRFATGLSAVALAAAGTSCGVRTSGLAAEVLAKAGCSIRTS